MEPRHKRGSSALAVAASAQRAPRHAGRRYERAAVPARTGQQRRRTSTGRCSNKHSRASEGQSVRAVTAEGPIQQSQEEVFQDFQIFITDKSSFHTKCALFQLASRLFICWKFVWKVCIHIFSVCWEKAGLKTTQQLFNQLLIHCVWTSFKNLIKLFVWKLNVEFCLWRWIFFFSYCFKY